jgi:hypothetical protein
MRFASLITAAIAGGLLFVAPVSVRLSSETGGPISVAIAKAEAAELAPYEGYRRRGYTRYYRAAYYHPFCGGPYVGGGWNGGSYYGGPWMDLRCYGLLQ